MEHTYFVSLPSLVARERTDHGELCDHSTWAGPPNCHRLPSGLNKFNFSMYTMLTRPSYGSQVFDTTQPWFFDWIHLLFDESDYLWESSFWHNTTLVLRQTPRGTIGFIYILTNLTIFSSRWIPFQRNTPHLSLISNSWKVTSPLLNDYRVDGTYIVCSQEKSG